MNSKTLIACFRMGCGAAILITSMVTGVDGVMITLGVLCLGMPVEALQKDDKEVIR